MGLDGLQDGSAFCLLLVSVCLAFGMGSSASNAQPDTNSCTFISHRTTEIIPNSIFIQRNFLHPETCCRFDGIRRIFEFFNAVSIAVL